MATLVEEAQTVTGIGRVLSIIGWVVVAAALVLGIWWWIQFATSDLFNIIEALRISLNAIIVSFTSGLILAGVGHTMKLFAAYTVSRS